MAAISDRQLHYRSDILSTSVSDHQLHYLSDILSTSVISGLPYFLVSALIVSVLVPIYRCISRDYHKFLSLGPGGTPSNFAGYLKVSGLRLFTLKDPFTPEATTSQVRPINGYLVRLPVRPGPRPAVAGIAPQRQVSQKPSPELFRSFKSVLCSLAEAYPFELRKGTSCFEKNGLALFLSQSPGHSCETRKPRYKGNLFKRTGDTIEAPGQLNRTCGDSAEICHLHAIDLSMHLTLHPSDVALLIAHGWGERHPLAGCQVLGKRLLPSGFVMVYAPQDESQMGVLMDIVRAAGWWVGGKKFEKGLRGDEVVTL